MIMPDVQVVRTYTIIHAPTETVLKYGLTIEEAIEAVAEYETEYVECIIVEETK